MKQPQQNRIGHRSWRFLGSTVGAYLPRPTVLLCLIGALTAMLGPLASATPAVAEILVVQGSTTFSTRLLEPNQSDIESISGVKLQVIPNKSLNGLVALLEGRADLAMISAPLELELDQLRLLAKGPAVEKLQAHWIARSRVAFAVHPSNTVRTATLVTMRRILLGEIGNWKELGGPDQPIRIAYVAKAGGVTQTVQGQLLGGQAFTPANPIPLASPEQVVKVVEQEPGALGIAQLRLASSRKLPEITTDETIDQLLLFVSLGEPTPPILSVIEATRRVAERRLAIIQY